ncbi:hypothetical protein CTAYLR_007272 [Chrysophaeum taylorii]|uniref:Meckelin n=1 Tax=Chrysophaeum taylorii TaxID=2483200 RepID=A0AAD7UJ51_9STRA|nr:hypothetical protein CTAYLR_007272 [Chrysophaeum taylorii]
MAALFVDEDPRRAECASTEYLSTVSLACRPCAALAADDATAAVLVAKDDDDDDALTCKCPVGYRQDDLASRCAFDGSCKSVACVSCASLGYDASYSDNSGCAECGETTLGVVDGDCACGAQEVLVETSLGGSEYLETKYCAACAPGRFVVAETDAIVAGAWYEGSRYVCHACPDARMSFDGAECVCADGYALVGRADVGPQSCVDQSELDRVLAEYPLDEAIEVRFGAIKETRKGKAKKTMIATSATFEHYYANASVLCSYHDGSARADAACQTLANLCVLTNYDLRSSACALYAALRDDDREDRSAFGAKTDLPWLFYSSLSGEQVRHDAGIGMKMSLNARDGGGGEHRLQLRLATYALNGTFVGMEPLETQLFYGAMDAPNTQKGAGASRSTAWQRFGYSFRTHFRVKLPELLADPQYLYEVYVVDKSTKCGVADDCLYPIPVQNKALVDEDGRTVNRNDRTSDGNNDLFTRRFVLYDVASGIPPADFAEESNPKLMRVVVEMILRCESRVRKPNRIRTPYLELGYEDRIVDDVVSGGGPMSEVRVEFSVEYWMPSVRARKVANAFFFAWLALSVLWWIYAVRYWQTQQYGTGSTGLEGGLTTTYAWRCILLYARIFVRAYFPLVFVLCTYWLVFFKFQDAVFTMLPRENRDDGKDFEYYPVRTMIIVMWTFQTASVFQLAYDQCNREVFFLDWERPREQHFPFDAESHRSSVSAWRTVVVANKWAELQTARRTSLRFVLLGVGFVLLGLDYENNATPQPSISDLSDGHHNIALRFANTTWWILVFAGLEFLWRFCVWERFVTEPKSQSFVDFCTVANVSVLVLDAPYHGWYLHCEAPYSHADDAVAQLAEHLDNESCHELFHQPRGLDSRLPEVQCFQLWLTAAFRRAWAEVRDANNPSSSLATNDRRNLQLPPSVVDTFFVSKKSSVAARTTTRETAHAADRCSAFLRTFLHHEYRDNFKLDWVLRLPTAIEKLTPQPPPFSELQSRVIFVPDTPWFGDDEAWTSTTFLGHDWTLLLHEILTFAVADIWFKSTALSILLTYLLHHAVSLARSLAGDQRVA